jgi:uncharacterized protein
MVRLLLIAAIAAVAWYLYRRIVVKPSGTKATPPTPAANGQDTMTRCEHCNIHVPEKSGVRYQELFFCSPEHLNEHLRKQGQP